MGDVIISPLLLTAVIVMNHMWYVAQRLPTPSQSSGGRAPGNAGRQAEQVKARMQDVTTDRTKQVKADRKKNPPESSKTRHLRTVGQDLGSDAALPLLGSGGPWRRPVCPGDDLPAVQ